MGKRLSKFLSKVLWHFHQVVPTYAIRDGHLTRSSDKHALNPHYRDQQTVMSKDHIPIRSPAPQRMRSLLQRVPTLTSIAEENEHEVMTCK